jgi:hypothetical protein
VAGKLLVSLLLCQRLRRLFFGVEPNKIKLTNVNLMNLVLPPETMKLTMALGRYHPRRYDYWWWREYAGTYVEI